jgi:P-type Ca2+ transporter type 2C
LDPISYSGLDDLQVKESKKNFGSNVLESKGSDNILTIVIEVITEPLFILLFFTVLIYFGVGQTHEALIMIFALFFVAGISLYQERRSKSAVDSLKKLSVSQVQVTRSGITYNIDSDELVIGDVIHLEDGQLIPADAIILSQHDFAVDESILTGESLPVYKAENAENKEIFRGTNIVSGSCIARVNKVGVSTEIGKIGHSLENIVKEKTPLQIQIRNFTGKMVIFGVIAFTTICVFSYIKSGHILESLLKGLTLAMSVLPEEIPVALSTFMALGAYHLYRKGVIAKTPSTVETLGAATVICTDKTGTLTQNKMELAAIFDFTANKLLDYTKEKVSWTKVLETAMWASESKPFDSMEISIHKIYTSVATTDQRPRFKMVAEYPLAGKPPVMTHVFRDDHGQQIIAVKGGVEGVLRQTDLSEQQKESIMMNYTALAERGFRVLGVGEGVSSDTLPTLQSQFKYHFLGLIAFYDPPKSNINKTLSSFYNAGIGVKMITGDHASTAISIAKQVGLKNSGLSLDGDEILNTEMYELQKKVTEVNIYTRMFPEAKLKIIDALKLNGEIVAMTGDGVNDGPALKSAHIGIAMGKSGSDVAKNAASLILMDDDLSWMVDAVALGRRIYENLKKAIRYIISIHIPVILIVAVPILFSWMYIDIFTPVHVVFLELIMGPTCSIVFENEPIENNSMSRPPKKRTDSLFSINELTLSICQGLIITIACLGLGYYYMQLGYTEDFVRTIIYSTLIFSNIFLTLVNRSFYFSIFTTLKYRNVLLSVVLIISFIFLLLTVYLRPLREVFNFEAVDFDILLISAGLAFLAVIWIEFYKYAVRQRDRLYSK